MALAFEGRTESEEVDDQSHVDHRVIIRTLQEHTGWSIEQCEHALAAAWEIAGVSEHAYVGHCCWELPLSELGMHAGGLQGREAQTIDLGES